MDKITADIYLKGEFWENLIQRTSKKIFTRFYDMYVLAASIGILYDKHGRIEAEAAEAGSVPRIVLLNNKEELEILFQTAILTSQLVDFSEERRLELAFGETNNNDDFNDMAFLTGFANYGAEVLSNLLGPDDLDNINEIRRFLTSTVAGQNIDVDPFDMGDMEIPIDILNEL